MQDNMVYSTDADGRQDHSSQAAPELFRNPELQLGSLQNHSCDIKSAGC